MIVLTKFGDLRCSSWWLDGSGDHSYMTCLQLWVTSTTTTTYCFHSALYCQSLASHDRPINLSCGHHMQWHMYCPP